MHQIAPRSSSCNTCCALLMKHARAKRYISVNEEHGRQLFYYLVMSEAAQPSNDLIVWLTGGPGCSSMDAFTYEHGPLTYSFRPGELQLQQQAQ